MRVRTRMREIRGDTPLVDVERQMRELLWAPAISRADLSRFERGQQLPTDRQAQALETVYGRRESWFPATVAKALAPDLAPCPGCGEPLDPSVIATRRHHNQACRDRARAARFAGETEA